jgi:hypothetical protein
VTARTANGRPGLFSLGVGKGNLSPGIAPIGLVLVASSAMSYVPEANVGTGIFLAILSMTFLYLFAAVRPTIADARTAGALAFVIWATTSVVTLISSGNPASDWLRGVVPFLFFGLALFIPRLTLPDKVFLSRALFVAALAWLLRILITAGILALQGSDVLSVRLTFRVVDAVLPFPLIAVPYLLFADNLFKPYVRWVILTVIMYVYVWIGYRAGLLLITLPFALYFVERLRNMNLVAIGLVILGFFLFYRYGIFGSFALTDRFAQLSSDADGARSMELAYAYDRFVESPIIGKGIGWQVPGSVTFYGLDSNDGSDVASVGYVHSSLGYMAMTLGIIGVALYFFTTLPRPFRNGDMNISKFAAIALTLIDVFCFTQASFRSIQTILMIVVLMKLNAPTALPSLAAFRRG